MELQRFLQTITLGAACLCPIIPTAGRSGRDTQMGTKGKKLCLSWTTPLPHRVSDPSIKHWNWACSPPVPCGLWRQFLHYGSHEEWKSPRKLEKPGRVSLRVRYTGKIQSFKWVNPVRINRDSVYLIFHIKHKTQNWIRQTVRLYNIHKHDDWFKFVYSTQCMSVTISQLRVPHDKYFT